jgi:hypothetical protein
VSAVLAVPVRVRVRLAYLDTLARCCARAGALRRRRLQSACPAPSGSIRRVMAPPGGIPGALAPLLPVKWPLGALAGVWRHAWRPPSPSESRNAVACGGIPWDGMDCGECKQVHLCQRSVRAARIYVCEADVGKTCSAHRFQENREQLTSQQPTSFPLSAAPSGEG